MENGGNAKINAIFEARLAQSGRQKCTNLDNGPTRERFIRDKYERRKFYDPAAFAQDFSAIQSSAAAAVPAPGRGGGFDSAGGQPLPGTPSEIARQRVANRQARMKPAASSITDSYTSAATIAPSGKVAQAPVSAPVTIDLLDFSSDLTPSPAPAAQTGAGATDLFGGDPFASSAAAGAATAPPTAPPQQQVPTSATPTLAQDFMNNNPAPSSKPATSSTESIMALFGPPKQQQAPQSYGMQAMSNMNPTMMMGNSNSNSNKNNNMMMPMMNSGATGMQGMNSMNPQQQMMMGVNNGGMLQQGMVGMISPQMQQQMMMAQQMQMQMKQQQQLPNQFQSMQHPQHGGMMGGNNMGNMTMMNSPSNMMNNPSHMMNNMMGGAGGMNNGATQNTNMMMNHMMMGMQNMNMGGAGGIAQAASGDDGGFGAPMGGNSSNSNANDPFSSLGGMNAFR